MSKNPLRQLARSSKYQNLYALSKEISSIHFFENNTDLSFIQVEFLYWVSVYNRLYGDLASKTNKFLTQEMIEKDIACDCYLIWESKNRFKKETPASQNKKNKKQVSRDPSLPTIVFTKG